QSFTGAYPAWSLDQHLESVLILDSRNRCRRRAEHSDACLFSRQPQFPRELSGSTVGPIVVLVVNQRVYECCERRIVHCAAEDDPAPVEFVVVLFLCTKQ